MRLKTPYLLFLGDAPDQPSAKTASGVFQWRPEWCTGQLRLDGCKADVGVPDISVADAATAGAKTLVIGVVNSGGFMPESWTAAIVEALEAGMDVASGLHEKLQSFPEITPRRNALVVNFIICASRPATHFPLTAAPRAPANGFWRLVQMPMWARNTPLLPWRRNCVRVV